MGRGGLANGPMVTLRRRIEERGIKLPAGMKKVQLLRMYPDNFGGDDEMDESVTVAAPMPSASGSADRTDTKPTPTPPLTTHRC